MKQLLPFLEENNVPYVIDEDPIRSSEDFGHIAKNAPACFFLLGLGEDSPPIHNVAFEFPDEAIKNGINLFELLAVKGLAR